jgi:hypothetical protein
MLDLAFGKTWLDHPGLNQLEEAQRSLYVNREMGGTIFANRLKVMARNKRYTDIPDWKTIINENIYTLDKLAGFDMAQAKSREELEQIILVNAIQVVILDSLSMCWSGNENDNSEVGVFYAQLRGITERTGVCWAIIHHTLKPANTRKKDHLMFSIRGAGQIVQQADTAILLAPNEKPSGEERREVIVSFVKTRTEQEPPAFISAIETNDGFYTSLRFLATHREAAASDYAASPGDTAKLQEWVFSEMLMMPFLKPTGPGVRLPQLLSLLRMAWPVEDKNPPSEQTLRRALTSMEKEGMVTVLQKDGRVGALYRFPEELPEGVTVPVPPSKTANTQGRKKKEPVEDTSLAEEYLTFNEPPRKRRRNRSDD